MIQELEYARCNLYLANKRKENVKEIREESKLDSFDPMSVEDLLSETDSKIDDEELNDNLFLIASLQSKEIERLHLHRLV